MRKNRKKYVGCFSLYLVLFGLLLIFLLILLIKIQVEIKIIIKNGRNYSFVIFRLLRLLRIRINLSVEKDEKGQAAIFIRKTDSDVHKKTPIEQVFKRIKRMVRIHGKYKEQINYMKSKVKVNSFYVRFRYGTGDAASTALALGGLYAFFSALILYLKQSYKLQKQRLSILPYFQGPMLDLDLDCIINFKIGHIIITGLKMLMKKVKAV